MTRKSKKGITGKKTVPGTGFGIPGPGLDLIDNNLKSSKEIHNAEVKARNEERLK